MTILYIQAAYFIGMGIWPLLHMRSSEAVTGKKTDTWLVKTIGWFFIMIGLQIWFADDPRQVSVIGIGSAAIIGGVDPYYGLRGRISRIYLLDVVPQLVFIAGWILYL